MQHPHEGQEGALIGKFRSEGIWVWEISEYSWTLSFGLTKGTGEGGDGTAGCSAVVGNLGSPTCIIRLVPVFSRSVLWILRSVSRHTICFCILLLCSIFLALAMMGQTLHKTLWCLMHL